MFSLSSVFFPSIHQTINGFIVFIKATIHALLFLSQARSASIDWLIFKGEQI